MLQIRGQNIIKNSIVSAKISQSSQRTFKMQKPPLPIKKKSTVKIMKHEYLCDERKQNNLTSRFLKKKQKLFNVTKENIKIFQRINSQKSIYSHQSLNKSYQSNKSLVRSRTSQRSTSQLSQSRKSQHSKPEKKTFFNRAVSANQKSKTIKPTIKVQSRAVQETRPEDLRQFECLFKIAEQPTLKQRSRPCRVRSTQSRQDSAEPVQIVITEQNEIEIHEEISAVSRSGSGHDPLQCQPSGLSGNSTRLVSLSSSAKSLRSLHSVTRNCKENVENIENLFQLKHNDKFDKLPLNPKIGLKYTRLLSKITEEISRNKKPKESSLYHFKSRLIA